VFRLQPDQFVGRLLVFRVERGGPFQGVPPVITDTEIKALRPKAKPYKVSDSGGLHILVMPESSKLPKGSKLWKCAYRFAGRQKTLSFGSYPDVSLADARARREAAKLQLRQGIDPGHIIKAEKQAVVAARTSTFRAVADEWLDRKLIKQRRSASTIRRARRLLGVLKNTIGDRQLTEIEAPELLDVLRRVEARGNHETAMRMRAAASNVFRYGIAIGACKRDPASDLRGALTSATPTARPAVTDPAEIGKLLRAIDGLQRPIMRLALKLLSLTAVRPGELLSAEWSEITGDVWSVPEAKMKMRRPHRIPLSRQAKEVLAELRAITGNSRHLIASPRKRGKPYAANQLNYALRDIGFDQTQMVAHGFRAVFSTVANESGAWPPDVIELQLAHQERNKVRAAYNRAQRWPERVEMMQWLADHLDELRSHGGVIKLPGKKTTRRKIGA
jgi:integrase